jgi:hypothetical protein
MVLPAGPLNVVSNQDQGLGGTAQKRSWLARIQLQLNFMMYCVPLPFQVFRD